MLARLHRKADDYGVEKRGFVQVDAVRREIVANIELEFVGAGSHGIPVEQRRIAAAVRIRYGRCQEGAFGIKCIQANLDVCGRASVRGVENVCRQSSHWLLAPCLAMQSLYVAYVYRAADMKNNNDLTRRRFLRAASILSGTTLVRLSAPSLLAITQAACTARDSSAAFTTLANGEAADLAAIAARIIPTTDTPGANEAGVIHFFDNAFAEEMSDKLEDARKGLEALKGSIRGGGTFAELPDEEQDKALRSIEGSAFFSLMRQMTIFGFFAMSEYGGNKDHVGWELIGFKGHNGGWQYPFGYYDAQVHGGRDDGE